MMDEVKKSYCRSCSAEIVWAKIGDTKIPLNYRRVRAYRESDGGHREIDGLVRISHFLTCPEANKWSKK